MLTRYRKDIRAEVPVKMGRIKYNSSVAGIIGVKRCIKGVWRGEKRQSISTYSPLSAANENAMRCRTADPNTRQEWSDDLAKKES